MTLSNIIFMLMGVCIFGQIKDAIKKGNDDYAASSLCLLLTTFGWFMAVNF